MTDNYFDFIKKNQGMDTNVLRLSFHDKQCDFDLDFALLQIDCRNKTKRKLPRILQNPKFLFPDAISAEQSSAEALASFHSSLIQKGDSILDMTAGLGMDSFYMAERAKDVTSIELDRNKAQIFSHNIKICGKDNITPVCDDSVSFLRETACHFDVIFIDPARRDSSLKRVYGLKDSTPDVIGLENLLLKKADRILIKASPMIDISQTLRDFSSVSSIYAMGIKGECKEILIELNANQSSPEKVVKAINLDSEGKIIYEYQTIINSDSKSSPPTLQYATLDDLHPGMFILEPSPMMMKISPWGELCQDYDAKMFGPSSNLFISKKFPEKFPGRVTRLTKILTKKDRKSLIGLPVSVISRNFPSSSEELRKNFKLKEGDENFLYASRIQLQPVMLLCQKVQNL